MTADHAVDEHGLAVEDVDLALGHLAMHQQQQAVALQGFQGGVGLARIGHTGVAVGGGTGWVKLGGDHACVFGAGDFVGGQVVGEVERHQRLEAHTLRHSGQDALFVLKRLRRRGDGGLEVGHDDGAAKFGGGVGHHGVECSAIAHVQVPVVGSCDGDFLRHALIVDEVGVISIDAEGEFERLSAKYGPEVVTSVYGDDEGARLNELVEKTAVKEAKEKPLTKAQQAAADKAAAEAANQNA